MATQNLIQIKRSQATAVPPSLANGELAWSANGDTLWIGNFGTVTPVGGEGYILDLVQGGNFDIFANTITAASDLIAQTQLTIDQFSVNGITDDIDVTSNTTLITSQAIKDYVDSQFDDLANNIVFDDLNDVSVASASNNDILVYDGTNWANKTISANTSTGIELDRAAQNITVRLANTAVSAGAYGSANQVGTFTVDEQGRLTAAANVDINHDTLLGYVADEHVPHSIVFISGGDGLTGSGNIAANVEIEVNPQDGLEANSAGLFVLTGTGVEIDGNNAVRIGQPVGTSDSVTFENVTVSGNLFVEGTLTQIDTEQLKVEDNLIKLASNNTTDAVDIGFYGPYDDDGDQQFTGLYRDASDGTFKFFDGLSTSPGATVGTSDLVPIAVGGITVESTAGFINVGGTNGSAYQVLQNDENGLPVWGTLDGGTF